MIYIWLRVDWGVICLHNKDVNIGKGVKTGKKLIFAEIDPHSYFHASCALLKYFEIFNNFDNILTLFRPLKVRMTRLGQKFEL